MLSHGGFGVPAVGSKEVYQGSCPPCSPVPHLQMGITVLPAARCHPTMRTEVLDSTWPRAKATHVSTAITSTTSASVLTIPRELILEVGWNGGAWESPETTKKPVRQAGSNVSLPQQVALSSPQKWQDGLVVKTRDHRIVWTCICTLTPLLTLYVCMSSPCLPQIPETQRSLK